MNATELLTAALVTLVLLQVKHFICDGPLQTLAMVQGKSVYGKPIGIFHALIHGGGTVVVLAACGVPPLLAAGLGLLDAVIHYHIDFVKENIVKLKGWTHRDGPFWWALTADQALHHATYVGLVALAFIP
jgi:hypothetical protein